MEVLSDSEPNSRGQGARKHAGIGHQVQAAFVFHAVGAAFATSLGCLDGDMFDSPIPAEYGII